jgi:hypothetical protein
MGDAPWTKSLLYKLLFELIAVLILCLFAYCGYTFYNINKRISDAEVIIVKIGSRI